MVRKDALSLLASKRKLRFYCVIFMITLVAPLSVLVRQTLLQLEWESFHQTRMQAEALSSRIEGSVDALIQKEESRGVGDYQFLTVVGGNNFVQRSPLSEFPLSSDIPGLIGYFQINDENQLSTPVTPNNFSQAGEYGVTAEEYRNRVSLRQKLIDILSQNDLVASRLPAAVLEAIDAPKVSASGIADSISSDEMTFAEQAAPAVSQSAFDKLSKTRSSAQNKKSLGRLEDLKLDDAFQNRSAQERVERKQVAKKKSVKLEAKQPAFSKEKRVVAEALVLSQETEEDLEVSGLVNDAPAINTRVAVKIFDSEIEPFKVNLLDSGHIVVFRSVWANKKRLIQGFLLNQNAFFNSVVETEFLKGGLSSSTRLAVAHSGDLLSAYGAADSRRYQFDSRRDLSGNLLLKQKLSTPFNDFQLLFTIQDLGIGAGGKVVILSAAILFFVIVVGIGLFYRYALAQMSLMNQQQDFVSSVSHELKTPLTSIRMYGEILREGWADDNKKKEYYDYIFYESERLTRLINNVLQLAKLTRNSVSADLKECTVKQLSDIIRSKLSSSAERAGFELNIQLSDTVEKKAVLIDEDMFAQVAINLVDNSIKYAAKAESKVIDIVFSETSDKKLDIRFRDYGPGMERKQLKKIFTLFYRNENELTRETKGTGIGLALVRQYVGLMGGQVDAINKQPGVEIVLRF